MAQCHNAHCRDAQRTGWAPIPAVPHVTRRGVLASLGGFTVVAVLVVGLAATSSGPFSSTAHGLSSHRVTAHTASSPSGRNDLPTPTPAQVLAVVADATSGDPARLAAAFAGIASPSPQLAAALHDLTQLQVAPHSVHAAGEGVATAVVTAASSTGPVQDTIVLQQQSGGGWQIVTGTNS